MRSVDVFQKDQDITLSLFYCDQLEEVSILLGKKYGIQVDTERVKLALDIKRAWVFGQVEPSQLRDMKYSSYTPKSSLQVVFNFNTALFYHLSFQDPFHKYYMEYLFGEIYKTLRTPTKVQMKSVSEMKEKTQRDFISILKKRESHSVSHWEVQKQMLEEVLF